MIKKIKYWMTKITPKIHNLPHVIYINWMGYEWFISKSSLPPFLMTD